MTTATEIARSVRTGATGATDHVEDALQRASSDPCGAVRVTLADRARTDAAEVDAAVARGADPGPLAGVPFLVKDNIALAGDGAGPRAGSRILEGYESPFEATAVTRLRRAGAIPIGICHCDEFAMGSTGEHCHYGAPKNPWLAAHVPGGSSSGSAAAVGGNLVPLALGSDTGGSIRQPAAYCGAVGVKPSYGRVSRWGLIAYGSSLDQIGPFTNNVADAALVTTVLSGVDARDATSVDRPPPDVDDTRHRGADGLRLGILRDQMDAVTSPELREELSRAVNRLRQAGATVVEHRLDLGDAALAAYYVIACAEASSNLARYDGVRYGYRAEDTADLDDLYRRSRTEGFGPEVQRRIMLGTWVLSAGYHDRYYHRAMRARRLVADAYARIFADVDAVVGPVAPTLPPLRGADPDPVLEYASDLFTVTANLAGLCAMSVPCGQLVVDNGALPVGLHIQAPAFDETVMLRVATLVERDRAFTPIVWKD